MNALAAQTASATDFEVILVVDGGDPDTLAAAKTAVVPYSLHVLEQPHGGAGAARNLGARAANSELLVFLDDDMAVAPGFLAAHIEARQKNPGGVALGYFTQTSGRPSDELFAVETEVWWGRHFGELARPAHRYGYRDLCAGNFSIARDEFLEAGGFSEAFHLKAGEDYELGARLIARGAPFHAAWGAWSVHHFEPSARKALRRAYENGRGEVVLARMRPELGPTLRLVDGIEGGPSIKVGDWRLRPWMARALPILLAPVSAAAALLKLRRLWRRVFGLCHTCAYWHGVFDEAGTRASLSAVIRDLALNPVAARDLTLDILVDLDRLDSLLEEETPDAINVVHGETIIGRLGPIPGSEPLRPNHVRHALVEIFAEKAIEAIERSQSRYRHATSSDANSIVIRETPTY